jgi:hypothetical protein
LSLRIGYSLNDRFHGEYVYFGQARGKRIGTYRFDKKHDKEVQTMKDGTVCTFVYEKGRLKSEGSRGRSINS